MELPLLLSSTRLIPNTIEQALIELMRCQTIPLQAIKRKRIHARARGNQHHEGNELLCAGRDISGLKLCRIFPTSCSAAVRIVGTALPKALGILTGHHRHLKQMFRSPKEEWNSDAKARLLYAGNRRRSIHVAAVFRQPAACNQPNGVFLQYVRIEVTCTEHFGHALRP